MSGTTIRTVGTIAVTNASDGGLAVSIPIVIKRRGGRKIVTFPNGEPMPQLHSGGPHTPIQQALARGHCWLAMVESGQVRDLSHVAEREHMDRAYVSRMVNLTTLAPNIVAAILDEELPNVTLFDLASGTPLLWVNQNRLLEKGT